MVREDAVDPALCSGVQHMVGVEIASCLLSPIPVENVAVIVAVVAVDDLSNNTFGQRSQSS